MAYRFFRYSSVATWLSGSATFQNPILSSADRNQFHVEMELVPEASLEETRQTALKLRELLLEDKLVQRVDWVVGRSAPSFYYNMIGSVQDSPRYGQALVQTRTTHGNNLLIRRLQKKLNQEITNAQVRVRPLEQGPPFDAPIELRIYGNDRDELRAYGERVREILQKHPDVVQTKADLTDTLPKLFTMSTKKRSIAGVDLARSPANWMPRWKAAWAVRSWRAPKNCRCGCVLPMRSATI